MELFKLFGTIMVDNEKANKSISKTGQVADGLGSKLLNGAKTVGKWGVALGAAATAAGAAIYGVAQKAAGTTDRVDKMSQKIGISRKAYQELDFICSQSGTSVDKLQAGIKTLTSAMDGAKSGTVSNVEQFKRLGVAVTNADGSFRSQEDVMWDTLSALQQMENQTEKSRLATELFGRTGSELMPLLNGTSGSIEQMKKQAHDLGLVLNDKSVDAGVKLTDTIDQAKRSFDSIITRIGVGFMPLVQGVLNLIIENMPTIQNVLNGVFGTFGMVINGVTTLFNFIKPVILDVFSSIKTYWDENGNTTLNSIQNVVKSLYEGWMIIWPSLQNLLSSWFEYIKSAWETIGKPVFDFISDIAGDIFNVFCEYFPMVANIVKDVFNLISGFYTSILKPIIEAIGSYIQVYLLPVFRVAWGAISGVVRTCFGVIGSLWNGTLKPIFTGIISFVKGVFTGNWKSAWNGVKSIVSGVWNAIKTAITTPMTLAKNVVKGIIDAIKGFFNFKISWPHIPMPHFGIKPKGWKIGDLLKGEIPKLDIDWYAKAMDEGMILNNPTIFGAANGKLLGAGEAGSETVVGTQSLMDMINQAVSNSNDELLRVLKIIADRLSETNLYKVMVKAISDGGFIIMLDGRVVGRIVRKYA